MNKYEVVVDYHITDGKRSITYNVCATSEEEACKLLQEYLDDDERVGGDDEIVQEYHTYDEIYECDILLPFDIDLVEEDIENE